MRITDKYVFFFSAKDEFSNWYLSSFIEPLAPKYNNSITSSVEFTCVEQYMMWRKACLFYDYNIASSVLTGDLRYTGEKEQAYYKRLGRLVKDYDEDTWTSLREKIVKRGLYLKYTQNEDLKNKLIAYADKEFVEASPYDSIYGIKMGMWDRDVENKDCWKGQNLLGKWHTDLAVYLKTQSDIS